MRASTDLGSAVAATLVANVRDVLDPGAPRRVEVAPGDDLGARFDSVPSGSTLVLAAGTYRIDRPLVVIQDVTIRGAGPGRTHIVSTAADAAFLQPASVRLGLRDLEVRHTGTSAASVLAAARRHRRRWTGSPSAAPGSPRARASPTGRFPTSRPEATGSSR